MKNILFLFFLGATLCTANANANANAGNAKAANAGNAKAANANAGFTGNVISVSAYYPDVKSKTNAPVLLKAGDGIEFSGIQKDENGKITWVGPQINITDSSIIIDFSSLKRSGTFPRASFNGLVFSDHNDTVPDIINVTLDRSVTNMGIISKDITFTINSISVNLAGIKYGPASVIKLNVKFKAAPVPADK